MVRTTPCRSIQFAIRPGIIFPITATEPISSGIKIKFLEIEDDSKRSYVNDIFAPALPKICLTDPSCANTIVEKNISHVVTAIRDPHPKVNGEGIRILKEAGITVTEGIEADAARLLLADWLKGFE